MKINQLKLGTILSYLQTILATVIGIAYTPVMIRLLGQSEYGLYNTVSSTVGMLSLLNLGFNSGYVRFYSKYKKEDDGESIAKLNGLYLIIFIIMGAVALVCGLFLSFNLNLVFDSGLTSAEYETARVLFILLTINMATSFPMNIFVCIILAQERFVFVKLLTLVKTVVSPLVTLPILLMGYRSIAMVLITVILTFIIDVFYIVYSYAILKTRFVFHDFENGLLKNLFKFTFFIALNMLVDQINTNLDKTILGRFCGTASVAVYSVGYSLYSYYMSLSMSVSGVFTPRIHNIVVSNEDVEIRKEKLTELFVKVGRIQYLILALFATGILFFGKYFIMNFWAGPKYSESYYVAILLIIPATVPFIQNVGIEIQRAYNLHQFRGIVYFFMAIVNIGLSILFIQKYGTIGAPLGTAISFILANGVIMNVFYHKKCNIDIKAFWKSILSLSKGLFIPIVAGIIMVNFFEIDTLFMFSLMVIIYTMIYFDSMWLFGMDDREKNLLLKPLKKINNNKRDMS